MSSLARIEELERKYAESPRRFFAPLANEFRKAGDTARAIELCKAHLEQQPSHMSGQVVLGQALFDAGQKGEARAAFELALSLDPENLIALRHLGDLARESGDLQLARQRYKQVLDVDSRNHEVVAILREIDDAIAVDTLPLAVEHHAVTSSFPEASEQETEVAPVAEEEPAGEDSPYRPEGTVDAPEIPELISEPPPIPVVADEFLSLAGEEAPAHPESHADVPPVAEDDVTIPPAEEFGAASISLLVSDTVDAHADSSLPEPVASDTGLMPEPVASDAGLMHEPVASDSDDAAAEVAASHEEPEPAEAALSAPDEAEHPEEQAPAPPPPPHPQEDELASGEDVLEVAASGESSLTDASQPEEVAAEQPYDTSEVDDALEWELELLRSQTPPPEAETGEEWLIGFEVTGAADSPADEPDTPERAEFEWPEPAVNEIPEEAAFDMSAMEIVEAPDAAFAEEPAGETPAVFITETMAQLYENQGYTEMAVAVYRQLLERDPSNQQLRERIERLEKPAPPVSEAARDPRSVAARPGESARDFFAALVNVPLRPRLARPYVALRSDAEGQATSDPRETNPAREAPGALSLESVFRNGGARGGGSAAFSFDHFFTTGGQAPPTGGTGEKEPRARRRRGEDNEEIEQFNSWLEGLKKS